MNNSSFRLLINVLYKFYLHFYLQSLNFFTKYNIIYIISSTLSLELLSLLTFAAHKLHICCFPADVFMLQLSRFEMPNSHSRSLWNKEILWDEIKVKSLQHEILTKQWNNWRLIHTERGSHKLQRVFFSSCDNHHIVWINWYIAVIGLQLSIV